MVVHNYKVSSQAKQSISVALWIPKKKRTRRLAPMQNIRLDVFSIFILLGGGIDKAHPNHVWESHDNNREPDKLIQ